MSRIQSVGSFFNAGPLSKRQHPTEDGRNKLDDNRGGDSNEENKKVEDGGTLPHVTVVSAL